MHRYRLVFTALALTVILFSAFSAYGQETKTGSIIPLGNANGESISEGEICPNYAPEFEPPTQESFSICLGSTIHDTIVVTDINDWQTLTISQISGPGTFTTTPSFSPSSGFYENTRDLRENWQIDKRKIVENTKNTQKRVGSNIRHNQ